MNNLNAIGKHVFYMREALIQARMAASIGEVPVGAVSVVNDRIVAVNCNRIETTRDAAAHAEMLVLHDTCRILDRWRLDDVTLYVTVEPCPMCAMAMILHRIPKVVYGTPEPRTGAAGSFINLMHNPRLNHQVQVVPGVCMDEATELMKQFFKTKRSRDRADDLNLHK